MHGLGGLIPSMEESPLLPVFLGVGERCDPGWREVCPWGGRDVAVEAPLRKQGTSSHTKEASCSEAEGQSGNHRSPVLQAALQNFLSPHSKIGTVLGYCDFTLSYDA